MSTANTLEITTPSEREIRIVRRFAASRPLVFRAFTEPRLIRQWLLGPPGWTMPVCEVDLSVGGRFRYVWSRAGGTDMGVTGTFVEILPPEKLVHTELFDEDWTGGETTVTTLLVEEAGSTRVDLTVLHVSREARDGAIATGMTDGMESGYARLDELLRKLGVG